ncbi:MAG: hypothetical protein AAFX08_01560 [Pseudomonadota bacterium]
MSLQNRVAPTGEIVATAARGTLMGNRGGRMHLPDKTLSRRRWASKAWIACVLDFKGRRREVMSANSYTELFFLDEATALAAGHRPCFECRRNDANAFAAAFAKACDRPAMKAAEIDAILHRERRVSATNPQIHRAPLSDLPDGAMVIYEGAPHLWREGHLRAWSFDGYGPALAPSKDECVETLTPPKTLEALRLGYGASMHKSAFNQP